MYLLAPLIALVPSFLIFMIIPLGPDITVEWQNALYTIPLVGADLNVGVLYFLALSSIAVYSVVLAGWSSGSKYPLLGGVRASAQMISYEAAMGLALVPVILYSGSLSLVDIVNSQSGNLSPMLIPAQFCEIRATKMRSPGSRLERRRSRIFAALRLD